MPTASGHTSPLGTPRLMDLQFNETALAVPVAFARIGGMGFQFEGGVIVVNAEANQLEISFDRMMTYDGNFTQVPGNTPYEIGQPLMDTLTARILTIPLDVTLKPNLIRATPNNAGQGVALEFDSDVTSTSPTIDPPLNGLSVESATLTDPTHIQLDLGFPQLISTTLVSAIASDRKITLTFNKAVALTVTGQQTASYTITTVTPDAVIPTVTSIEIAGNLVILHTTEQTTGANYTVTVAPGSIYGTN